jgi:thiamine biosynthesis lipoprotein
MPETPRLEQREDYWVGHFMAMASPCELLMDVPDPFLANQLVHLAYTEAKRIEHKFSRYRTDNIIYKINNSAGEPVEVDEETAKMLDYADQCFQLSDGKFDVTSGVLRAVWKFDGSDRVPTPKAVAAVLPRIGWQKVSWRNPVITLPAGMEIDFGGIGKEYAVDKTAQILGQQTQSGLVVNFGGDLYVTGPRPNGQKWRIGIDDPTATGKRSVGQVQLTRGGIATSGEARRFLLKDGVRYSHILDPTTGWPVADAPRSVTVLANTCIEAGMLATFALLQGAQAREFLEAQGVNFWIF